jgi:hypothetical protein
LKLSLRYSGIVHFVSYCAYTGVSENNRDGEVRSTGTTQTLLEQNYKAMAAAKIEM